jgi:hypothetical protein
MQEDPAVASAYRALQARPTDLQNQERFRLALAERIDLEPTAMANHSGSSGDVTQIASGRGRNYNESVIQEIRQQVSGHPVVTAFVVIVVVLILGSFVTKAVLTEATKPGTDIGSSAANLPEYKTEFTVTGFDGFQYKVSKAHLSTSPTVGGDPVPVGYKAVIADFTVQNLQDDRPAHQPDFTFTRPASAFAADCEPSTGDTMTWPYKANIIDGRCTLSLTNCNQPADEVGGEPDIAAGEKVFVRCRDGLFIKDDQDVSAITTYFVPGSLVTKSPLNIRIPAE